jgi:alpha-tubulin suppressor-like RCC1 family protein
VQTHLARFASLALAALVLAACDDGRSLIEPAVVSNDSAAKLLIPIRDFPRIVPPDPNDFAQIVAGDDHTCARKNDGRVYCWGNLYGYRTEQFPNTRPTLIPLPIVATKITAGFHHTCALNSAGTAYCWGANDQSQLGLSNQVGLSQPFSSGFVAPPVGAPAGAPALSFVDLAAGGRSTCGATATQVFCWGEQGDIRNWSPTWTNAPTLIANYFGGLPVLALGRWHACILATSFHELDCWGSNNVGQAGVDPAQAMFYPGTTALIFAQATGLGANVVHASSHLNFTCADLLDNTVSCFGDNSNRQLGFTGVTGLSDFRPHRIGNGQLHGVSAGSQHACALDPAGQAWCWGSNEWGQLGANLPPSAVLSSPTPQQVQFPSGVTPVTFRAIAAGRSHTCAIGTDNHIYCWGQLDLGQLGIGAVVPSGFWSTAQRAIDP